MLAAVANGGENKLGMSVVLRVIIIATVLIVFVMSLLFVGGQGLERFKINLGESKERGTARIKCEEALNTICNSYPDSSVMLRYTSGDSTITPDEHSESGIPLEFEGRKCADVLGVADIAYYNCPTGDITKKPKGELSKADETKRRLTQKPSGN